MRSLVQLLTAASIAACGTDALPVTPNSGFTWPEVSALQAGLDTGHLNAMVRHVVEDLPNVNAIVLIKDGALAFEWYHDGTDADDTYDTFSVTKSALATMVGIALHRGWIDSLDQPITDFYPELARDDDVDPRVANITLRHLLTMTSGLEVELSQTVPLDSRDLVQRLLRIPLLSDPGTAFLYDAANSHVLSGALSRASGHSVADIANSDMFQRFNVTGGQWLADYEAVNLGWTGLFLSARDLAKLGELYRNDGVWMGERLLPPGFAALAAGTVAVPRPDDFADYGLHWWNTTAHGTPMWIAAGFRHQYIVIYPELALVAVLQSESRTLRGPVEDHFHLFTDYILPAAGGP